MPPTVFSKNVDLKLIQLVKENPVLYNPRHPKYTDSDTREVTWQKIGDSLSRPAVAFAGIQCQIHFGDFQEDKHKPGFIENLKEYMPEHYVSGWNIEKKVLKEYRKHQGLSSVEAKHLYIKTARALPTYGVTFFLVKEKQKDKKKLVPRLLGINSEAILRLDETSKEILQQWPLTHVKTYHASKGDIFTLNFGDYSDKEYSVKTCDAYKIRDILESYIDLIRQRMMAPGHGTSQDTSYITQDNITCSQANVVQHMSSGAMKLVDQSLVGPSSIISTESGTKGSQGAHYVTVQHMIVKEKGQHSQQAIKSEVGMRGDMPLPFTRRLNRLNSNSVKIVSLLTDEPSDTHMEDSRKIVEEMNADLPFVREGVHETIEKQTNEEEKKKLQEQMQELDELMKLLTENTAPGRADASEAGDAAMRIADVTTQMYFALNSKLKRRSKIISRSRPSFVEDENTQRSLRKASFIAASATALHSTHEAANILDQEYKGPALDAHSRAELEAAAVDRLGKVNAAVAHYIMAYSDPHNVDYDAAIISMNTINEIMPEYAKDAQALASCKDPKTKEQIVLDSRALCDVIRKICSATEGEDKEKMQQSIKDYTDTSGRLVFVFSRGKNNAKENEMLDLADEAVAATSKLLMMAQELTQLAPAEPAARDVDAAGVRTADAAKDLITQVQLAAPTIHSPHCQSAVTAAAEGLSSSVQRLAASWKPLEAAHQPPRDSDLHHQVMELARALDRLKEAYSGLGGDVEDVFDSPAATQEQQRLKFICTVNGNQKQWKDIDHLIAQCTAPTVSELESQEALSRLSARVGQLNAAIAALLAATADREHADYGTAELAVNTIGELMPLLVQDSKLASANKDAEARAAMMQHVRSLCDASRALCGAEHTPQNRSEAIAKFTNASGKLVFGANHRGNPDKEQRVLELTEEACQKASQLVSGTDRLARTLEGKETTLSAKGAKCSDAAKALRTTAQVTAHSISEPRCQSALLSSVDKLSSSGQDLAESWRQLDLPDHQVEGLETTIGELQSKLDGLKGVCGYTDDVQQQVTTSNMETPREQQKLKFITTLSGASEQIQRAQKALDKPIPPPQPSDKAQAIKHRLSGRLGELNAAIAALLAATDREEPDYKSADDAARKISELMPYVVQDTQLSCANKEAEARAAMLDLIRELCEASRAVCSKADGGNSKDLSDAVGKFSDVSGKLVYVVNPRANALRESQIMGLTASAGNQVSQLLAAVEPLSQCSGPQGQELDGRGAAVADAARALVATAQVVAPSISDPHSKAALLSSIDQLVASNQQLENSWRPLSKDPRHRQQTAALEQPHQQLLDNLEALRNACVIPDTEVPPTQPPTDANNLKFITTISAAREKIQSAQKALDKPIPPPLSSDKAEAVLLRLSGRLGELNAAIAALLNATADRQKADYKTAEEAVNTITELLPHVIQDTQASCASKEAGTRAAMLDLARAVCDASAAVCAAEDATDPQALSSAVTKFSEAAGKLVYVVNPRVNADRERQIKSLSAGACQRASHILAGVQQLVNDVEESTGIQLDSRAADMADAAQTLAHTTQVTAASISEPSCKKALLLSVAKLRSSSQRLADAWRPLLRDPTHLERTRVLELPQEHLEIQLEEIKNACQMPDGNGTVPELPQDLQRLQFVKRVSGARAQLEETQKALDKPIPPPLSSDKAEAVQLRLSGRLGELNAAIAALLNATADCQRPDYKTAEEAVKTITELLPLVAKDTQSTCASAEPASRAAILDHVRALCAASADVCAHAHGDKPQSLDDAVSKFSTASNKLMYEVNPRNNADRHKQILDLSMEASKKATHLLSAVQKLPTSVEGRTGRELEAKSRWVDDAARALVAIARVTAPTISAPHCKRALLSSADQLSSSARELVSTWKPLLQGYSYSSLRQPLQQLETRVEELKTACDTPGVPKKKAPAAPARSTSIHARRGPALEATEQFLHRLRTDESQGDKARPQGSEPAASRPAPPAMTDDEKRHMQLFLQSAEEAARSITKAEEDLKQSSKSPDVDSAISAGECMAKQARLQRNIALAGVEVASLVGANYADKMDYTTATKCIQALPQLLSAIVEDGRALGSTVLEESRRALAQEMRHVCAAAGRICDAATNDRENLNDAAIEFGDKSAKLLYIVSNDVDPTLETEIITRAKAIGDSLANISVMAGGMASDGGAGCDAVPALCAAGARAQDAAGKLIYTTKLVAPSIYESSCQQALFNSADNLSTELRGFTESWQPFASDPRHGTTVKELGKEADNLERILEGLKSDVKDGRVGQLREMLRLVVEDTPIRQLTVKVMQDAKKLSESPELSPVLKREYVGYCKKLSDALRALDLSHARCKRTPHDTNKRRELENAIQNLQMILLQSRPTRGERERSYIVDLNDFIEEVSAEADKLSAASGALEVPVFADKKILENITNKAQKISKAAYALTHRDCESGFDTSYDNILDVDQFGLECDEIVADIDRQLQSVEDAKARNSLLARILPLTESCNLLRFATKSGIAAAEGASLDSTLDDLDDIESRVITSIVKHADSTAGVTLRPGKSPKLSDPMAGINLSRAVCESPGCVPRAPLNAYVASAAAGAGADAQARNQVLKHLYKVVHLLRTRAAAAGRRRAVWQRLDHPELAAVTQQLLQEIQNPESKFLPESEKVKRIVNESDLNKLLVPAPAKRIGDSKQQEDKLSQLSTKLNSMSGTLMLSIASPESLTRSAHAASDAAVELAAVARGCKDKKDPVRCERIEEAVQNMTLSTYGVLTTAELACRDQHSPNASRRLREAVGGLNEAIRRLLQSASTASPLRQQCSSLALALAGAPPPAAASALPFRDCCHQLARHQETIHKLKNEQPMSRQEFARSLAEVNDAVCQTSALSSQCAYLISVSEQDPEIAEKGPVDVPRIQRCIERLQDACIVVIGSNSIQQAKEETEDFNKRLEDFSRALDEAQLKVKDGGVKATLTRAKACVTTSAAGLTEALEQDQNMDKVTPSAVTLLEEVNRAHALIDRCPLVPSAGTISAETKARCDELTNNNKTVITHTLALVKEVSAADEDETLTWVTFHTSRTRLLDAYDALLKSIRVNGHRAGFLESTPEDDADEDAQSKTYLDTQVDLANKWLKKPMCKAEVKSMDQQAVRDIIDIATEISEDLKGSEREEIRNVIMETEELLTQCTAGYDNEKYTALMDRIKDLKKAIQRGVVTRVVEDFIGVDDPVADLDLTVDTEPDAQKCAFLLERKIAELLAQLGRVARTARGVARAGGGRGAGALLHCTEQTELLAPMLVQAAQERIASPDNKAVRDNYKALLAKYAESITKVRDLCDRAVDPLDFVQTAGEAMLRLREESSTQNDVQKGHRTSEAVIKLANRSIDISMSSLAVRRNPELLAALQAAQRRVLAATPAADCRASRLPDWRESTAEVLRTTGEVESALGGENIFKKEPTAQQGSNQQIYSVARDLHECVKDWSSRDNEIVAVARRMAVLMARLSEYLETDKKQAVITTSKSIVSESHEVAALARKLAHECSDIRIKTNLLQTCERIPTISAQLKMLTTVKSSTLGQQGTREDTEAMDMLVGNAQSLMLSIQEVVKAAASASVKIMSQRGPRLRWVRKNYY